MSNVEAIVETLVRDFQPFLVVLYGSRALIASRFAPGLGDRYLVGHAWHEPAVRLSDEPA